MAGKFNITITGSSQSVFMGDNPVVNINQRSGNRDESRRVPSHAQAGTGGLFQETQTDGGDFQSPDWKISKGFALVIHNNYLQNMPERGGSKVDSEAIKDFCRDVRLLVNDTDRPTENITARDIEELCCELSKRDFTNFDGFVCFILSHGNDSVIYGTDDEMVTINKIVNLFKRCPGLVDKPKLFFIQACLGKNRDFGLEADSSRDNEDRQPLHLPTDADTLVAYSSVSGDDPNQLSENGSWFIQTLLGELKKHAHHRHLMDILTCVNKKIAHLYAETPASGDFPCQMSTLTKFVYFDYPSPLTN